MSLLIEGHNTWAITRAKNFAFLVDGQEYFSATVKAMRTAKKRIDILGWDINSQIELQPELGVGTPTLGSFLKEILDTNEELTIRILVWSPPMMYATNREYFMKSAFQSIGQGRIHFVFNAVHPLGASHHQKVIIIDDRIAFAGGIDLTAARWDTREHLAHDPRRRDPAGHLFIPIHDVQVCMTGEVASQMAILMRERWKAATGEDTEPVNAEEAIAPEIPWHIHDAKVGIARTQAPFQDRPAITESQKLYLGLIKSAEHDIFIENQYFTSSILTDALSLRLRSPSSPRITIILPRALRSGIGDLLLEILRIIRMATLSKNDRYRKLHVYYPYIQGVRKGLYIHSKVLIVDDTYAVIGSSNCTDRSMGLDSECDIALDAEGRPDVMQAIKDFREGLLAEHSAMAIEDFRTALALEGDSLPTFVHRYRKRPHTLRRSRIRFLRWWQKPLAKLNFVDTPEPTEYDSLIVGVHDPLFRKNALIRPRMLLLIHALSLGAFTIGLTWWWVFGDDDSSGIRDLIFAAQTHPFAPLWIAGLYIIGSALFLPYNALTLIAATIFPAHLAFPYTVLGGTISAVVFYGFGRLLGAPFLDRLFSGRITSLKKFFLNQRISTVAFLRLLPVAPFTMVNIAAGSIRVPFVSFGLGTALGLAPGTLMLVLFQRSLLSLLLRPDRWSATIFLLALCILAWIGYWMWRRVGW